MLLAAVVGVGLLSEGRKIFADDDVPSDQQAVVALHLFVMNGQTHFAGLLKVSLKSFLLVQSSQSFFPYFPLSRSTSSSAFSSVLLMPGW